MRWRNCFSKFWSLQLTCFFLFFFNELSQFVLYKTNRLHFLMCTYCNTSQKMSQGVKNNSHAGHSTSSGTFFFFTHCDVICDLLQYARTENVIYLLNTSRQIINHYLKVNVSYIDLFNGTLLVFFSLRQVMVHQVCCTIFSGN